MMPHQRIKVYFKVLKTSIHLWVVSVDQIYKCKNRLVPKCTDIKTRFKNSKVEAGNKTKI